MRNKLGFAAALVLLTAALTAPRVEASACSAACLTSEHNCFNACGTDTACRGGCVDQWNGCLGSCGISR